MAGSVQAFFVLHPRSPALQVAEEVELARRTRAERVTSILSISASAAGRTRHALAKEILRTVNVAGAPPRSIPITMPSNTEIGLRRLAHLHVDVHRIPGFIAVR